MKCESMSPAFPHNLQYLKRRYLQSNLIASDCVQYCGRRGRRSPVSGILFKNCSPGATGHRISCLRLTPYIVPTYCILEWPSNVLLSIGSPCYTIIFEYCIFIGYTLWLNQSTAIYDVLPSLTSHLSLVLDICPFLQYPNITNHPGIASFYSSDTQVLSVAMGKDRLSCSLTAPGVVIVVRSTTGTPAEQCHPRPCRTL